jgi:hypothetical protein
MEFIRERKEDIRIANQPIATIKEQLKDLDKEKIDTEKVTESFNSLLLGDSSWCYLKGIRHTSYYFFAETKGGMTMETLMGLQLAKTKAAMLQFLEDALIGYSTALCENFLKELLEHPKRIKIMMNKLEALDGLTGSDTTESVIPPLSKCWRFDKGEFSFENVVKRLSLRLTIEKGILVIKPLEKREMKTPMVTEVAGLFQFFKSKGWLVSDLHVPLRDVFLTEFKLEFTDSKKKMFEPEQIKRSNKSEYWDKLYTNS